MPFYKFELAFEANDYEEAEDIADDITLAYCKGLGKGFEHECVRTSWFGTGPIEIKDEDD